MSLFLITIFSATLQGIRVDNDGYTKVTNNKMRSIGDAAIRIYPATVDGSRRAKNQYVKITLSSSADYTGF